MFEFKIFNPARHSAINTYCHIGKFHSVSKELGNSVFRRITDDKGYRVYAVVSADGLRAVYMEIGIELIFKVLYKHNWFDIDFEDALAAVRDLNTERLFIAHLPTKERKKARKELLIKKQQLGQLR